jgi:beta-lactamase regulating signal transducer with metallopeptidase domain
VEEHFSAKLGCNVLSVASSTHESVNGAEVVRRLTARFQPAAAATVASVERTLPTATVSTAAGSVETKAAKALEDAAKSAEEVTAKAGGKAKWIVGGIIAATVAVGAYIMHKRKSAVDREQERRQNSTTERSVG